MVLARYGTFHVDPDSLLVIVTMLLIVGALARKKPRWFLEPIARTCVPELTRIRSVGATLLRWAILLAGVDVIWRLIRHLIR
jgi:hypothetical protein